jgi:hypothetical protein
MGNAGSSCSWLGSAHPKTFMNIDYYGDRPLVWWPLFLKKLFPLGVTTPPKFSKSTYTKHVRK